MINWLRAIINPNRVSSPSNPALLELESRVHSLELELAERDKTVQALKEDVRRLRENQSATFEAEKSAQLERFFYDLAPQVTQLVTQAHLVEIQSKTLQNADILTVTNRLLQTIQRYGFTIESNVGERVNFDPSKHLPLNQAAVINPGQPVIVRFAGVSYRGKILRKIGVEIPEGQP